MFIEFDKRKLNVNSKVSVGVLYRPPDKDITCMHGILNIIKKEILVAIYPHYNNCDL